MITIINFLKKMFSPERIKFTLGLIIIILFILNLNSCNNWWKERQNRKMEQALTENNLKAMTDSITKTFNKKLDAFEYDKRSLMLKMDDLQEYNKGLYNEIKNVKGDVITAIKTQVTANIKPLEMNNQVIQYSPNNYGLRFHSDFIDKGLTQVLGGVSKFSINDNKIIGGKTLIDTNMLALKLTFGHKEEKGQYKVWALSQSPLVTIDSLTGAYFIDKAPSICPDPSRWHFGPYIGIGLGTNLTGGNAQFGYSLGVSVQYDILPSFKKKWWSKINK